MASEYLWFRPSPKNHEQELNDVGKNKSTTIRLTSMRKLPAGSRYVTYGMISGDRGLKAFLTVKMLVFLVFYHVKP